MKPLYNTTDGKLLKQQLEASGQERTTISFYRYWPIANPPFFRDFLFLNWENMGVFGRIYVASEGINAQLSVPTAEISVFVEHLYSISFLEGIRLNIAVEDNGKSFFRLTIKVKDKIVADGLDDAAFDASQCGTHLKVEEFNALTDQDDTLLVDMRNHYESEVGHFEGAVCPDVDTFREEIDVLENLANDHKGPIVMYCTGGIRCEKASAYLKHKGFDDVYQLEGGIIEYARNAEEKGLRNKFQGKNFVFDERMAERISDHVVSQCHQCGTACDDHTNCANTACHTLFIQCPNCKEKYEGTCGPECKDFIQLPEEEQIAQRKGSFTPADHFRKGRKVKERFLGKNNG